MRARIERRSTSLNRPPCAERRSAGTSGYLPLRTADLFAGARVDPIEGGAELLDEIGRI